MPLEGPHVVLSDSDWCVRISNYTWHFFYRGVLMISGGTAASLSLELSKLAVAVTTASRMLVAKHLSDK